jgi:pyruvate, water dikinase
MRFAIRISYPVLICLVLGFMACTPGAQVQTAGPDYLHRLETREEFDLLKGKPLTEKYGMVESVKIVLDLRDQKLYFTSSTKWRWHYDFCHDVLGFWQSNFLFNEANYGTNPNRRFALANINHYLSDDRWTLEFSSADNIAMDLVADLYRRVADATFVGKRLQLFLNTTRLEKAMAAPDAPKGIATVMPSEIYAGLTYQALNCKKGYGYLRRIPVTQLETDPPGPTDIVVLDGPALDIPAVAGLLTPEFQTPLSHLNILCKNRGTPFIAQKGIWNDSLILALENQLVYFEVFPDSFHLWRGELKDATKHWESQRPHKVQQLKLNAKVSELQPMDKLGLGTVDLVGGKASNFAVLQMLAAQSGNKWRVPEGAFAIPFYWYAQHFQQSGAREMAEALLADAAVLNDTRALKQRLLAIQGRMEAFPLDPRLIRMVEEQVRKTSPTLRMRFRSSTNAEDIEGFNGAGLYESRTGIVGDTARTVADAIRQVWASLWNFRAFQEREYFRIDHMHCAMGILVHRSFPGEQANGVAITKNLYRPNYYGFVINVQQGETSVVSPPPGVECDQLICYSDSDVDFYKDKRIIEYITYSNQTGGKAVLSEEEVVLLTEQLAEIKRYYFERKKGYAIGSGYWDEGMVQAYNQFALDLEFKLDGVDRVLYIKQVRPYND